MMNVNAIRPDGPTIAIEHQATGETPVYVTPDGIQPAAQAAEPAKRKTNGDWLRNSITDEQLAKWLAGCEDRARRLGLTINSPTFDDLVKAWLVWLKEEAKA